EHPVGLAAWAPGWGEPDVWRPLPLDASDRNRRDTHYLLTLARLKSGISLSQARADIEAVSQRGRKEHPDYQWGSDVAPWRERVVGQSRPALLMLSRWRCVFAVDRLRQRRASAHGPRHHSTEGICRPH